MLRSSSSIKAVCARCTAGGTEAAASSIRLPHRFQGRYCPRPHGSTRGQKQQTSTAVADVAVGSPSVLPILRIGWRPVVAIRTGLTIMNLPALTLFLSKLDEIYEK